jgi:SAM-dependent methyltransferase
MNRKEHWNEIYETKGADDVSWFQRSPSISLSLIQASGVEPSTGVIDVGGGASALAEHLLEAGYFNLAVLDISAAALTHARERMGANAAKIEWIEADITRFAPSRQFGVWHDRAVFHFLTDHSDRRSYIDAMTRALLPGGHAIIATFALDGPENCSGLEVVRYDAPAIAAELGDGFKLVEQVDETHHTPWDTEQRFSYFHFAKGTGSS